MLRLRLVDVVAVGLHVQRLITRLTDARRLVYLIVFGVQHGSLLLVYHVYNTTWPTMCTTWPSTTSVVQHGPLLLVYHVLLLVYYVLLLVYHVYNLAHYY